MGKVEPLNTLENEHVEPTNYPIFWKENDHLKQNCMNLGSRRQRNPGLAAVAKGPENQWEWNICWMFFLFPGSWSNATKKFELFFKQLETTT